MSQRLTQHLPDIEYRAAHPLDLLDTMGYQYERGATVKFTDLRVALEKLYAHVQGLREQSERG